MPGSLDDRKIEVMDTATQLFTVSCSHEGQVRIRAHCPHPQLAEYLRQIADHIEQHPECYPNTPATDKEN